MRKLQYHDLVGISDGLGNYYPYPREKESQIDTRPQYVSSELQTLYDQLRIMFPKESAKREFERVKKGWAQLSKSQWPYDYHLLRSDVKHFRQIAKQNSNSKIRDACEEIAQLLEAVLNRKLWDEYESG